MSNKKCRAWCFTLNNYTDDDWERIKEIDCRYLVVGKETAPTTGTKHLQGYIVYTNQVYMPKNLGHVVPAKGDSEQNYTYCSKGGDFYEKGDRPMTPKRKGEQEKERWQRIIKTCVEGKVEDLRETDPSTYVHYYRTLQAIAKDHMVKPPDLQAVCGRWYYGAAGKGKTTCARTEFPNAYIKSRDKWWDGYQGEEVVILDDLDKYHLSLACYLKDWGDKWTFKAEIKGGYLWIRPKVFIVTSQYHYWDIWTDIETRQALDRRYELKFFT